LDPTSKIVSTTTCIHMKLCSGVWASVKILSNGFKLVFADCTEISSGSGSTYTAWAADGFPNGNSVVSFFKIQAPPGNSNQNCLTLTWYPDGRVRTNSAVPPDTVSRRLRGGASVLVNMKAVVKGIKFLHNSVCVKPLECWIDEKSYLNYKIESTCSDGNFYLSANDTQVFKSQYLPTSKLTNQLQVNSFKEIRALNLSFCGSTECKYCSAVTIKEVNIVPDLSLGSSIFGGAAGLLPASWFSWLSFSFEFPTISLYWGWSKYYGLLVVGFLISYMFISALIYVATVIARLVLLFVPGIPPIVDILLQWLQKVALFTNPIILAGYIGYNLIVWIYNSIRSAAKEDVAKKPKNE